MQLTFSNEDVRTYRYKVTAFEQAPGQTEKSKASGTVAGQMLGLAGDKLCSIESFDNSEVPVICQRLRISRIKLSVMIEVHFC